MNAPPPPQSGTASPVRAELGDLLRLALPVIALQLGMRAMGTVDMMMVGHVSQTALASVAVGNAWFWFPCMFGIGFLLATDPLFSQAVGARDDAAIARTMQRGLLWAAVVTVPLVAVVWQADTVLAWSEQPEGILPGATLYARIASWSLFPVLVYGVLRQALQAHSELRALLITILLANGVNALANYALVFGHFGFPPMGVEGAAWATVFSRSCMPILLLAVAWPRLGPLVRSFADREIRRRAIQWGGMLRVARVGLPIAVQLSIEVGVFAATTILVGRLGEVPVAAHQITLDLASVTFMVPMGLGVAASVRIGRAVGRGDMPGMRRSAKVTFATTTVVMLVLAAVLFLAADHLPRAYTDDLEVIAFAALLLPIAAVFQLVDGLQTAATGVLRGVGETRLPMIVNLVGFWLVGFPFGCWLTFDLGLGAAGMWWGLLAGLSAVAAGLLIVARLKLRQDYERLAVD